jgi:SagB-type dehydrogenase family enzyme
MTAASAPGAATRAGDAAHPGELALRYARAFAQARRRDPIDWRLAPPVQPADPADRLTLPWATVPGPAMGLLTVSRLLRDAYGPYRQTWSAPGGLGPLLAETGRRAPAAVPGHVKRPVPSGGARYPVDLYVAGAGVPGLPDGVYRYQPGHHALARVAGTAPGPPGLTALVGVDFARNAFKYGDFGYRLHCLDAGAVVAELVAVAGWLGCRPRVRYDLDESRAADLLGIAPDHGGVYAAVDCTAGLPVWCAGLPPPAGRPPHWESELPALVHRAARAAPLRARPGTLPAITATLPGGPAGHPLPAGPAPAARPRGDRRSCLGYFSGAGISTADLAVLLHAATEPYLSDLAAGPAGPQRTALFLVVNHVHGLPPGCYRYDPDRGRLLTVRSGDLRVELHLALVSRIFDSPRSAVCLFPVSEFETSLPALGDRWYRVQHLEAGLVTQRLYRAVAGLGLACHAHCGYDVGRLRALLGLTGTGADPLIEVMVGGARQAGITYELSFVAGER